MQSMLMGLSSSQVLCMYSALTNVLLLQVVIDKVHMDWDVDDMFYHV